MKMLYNIFILVLFRAITPSPMRLVQNIAENSQFQDIDNYLSKSNDLPKYEYSTFQGRKQQDELDFNLHKDDIPKNSSMSNSSEHSSKISDDPTLKNANHTSENYTISFLDPFTSIENNRSSTNRTLRQESENSTASDSPFGNQIENPEEDEEEGGGENMITGIISALLGGLSRPDGSIDVEAITGLLGSLSMQNPDGSYNFMGLTDLIRGFFGGGDGGGGSDIGSFLGGLVGALLQGFANPPGAKGVGKFTGSLVGNLLPSLSALPPKEDGEPQQGIDPLGFTGGFLKTFFNTSSAISAPTNSTRGQEGGKSKYSIFKAIVSTITSIFTSSSGSSSSCMPTMLC